MQVHEELALQQVSEQRKFAEINKNISESLLQIMSGIDDLDIAAGTIETTIRFSQQFYPGFFH